MKKRLRKKLGVGEFKELCFDFFADIAPDAPESLFDDFIKVVEANEFYCEGSWGDETVDLYISTGLLDDDNAERRAEFLKQAAALPGLLNVKGTELE